MIEGPLRLSAKPRGLHTMTRRCVAFARLNALCAWSDKRRECGRLLCDRYNSPKWVAAGEIGGLWVWETKGQHIRRLPPRSQCRLSTEEHVTPRPCGVVVVEEEDEE